MVRVQRLKIAGYRSISEPIEIRFPENMPLVLIGENNAGKSNIVRALEVLLGERRSKSYTLESHEVQGRSASTQAAGLPVTLSVTLEDKDSTTLEIGLYPRSRPRQLEFQVRTPDDSSVIDIETDPREKIICLFIGAERQIENEVKNTSGLTLLSRLSAQLHRVVAQKPELGEQFAKIEEQLNRLLLQIPTYATSETKLRQELDSFKEITECDLSFQLLLDEKNYFRSLRAVLTESHQERSFEELGTGQEKILAICLAYAYALSVYEANKVLLVIEEPEAHLHPLAPRWIAEKLRDLAKAGVQVIITTHSPAFLDILGLEGWVRVYKQSGKTRVVQLSTEILTSYCKKKGANRATEDNILEYYSASATEEILSGMFARIVFLVEGATEALALPIYLQKVGLNTDQEGIPIIPVHGRENWRPGGGFSRPSVSRATSHSIMIKVTIQKLGSAAIFLQPSAMIAVLNTCLRRPNFLLKHGSLYSAATSSHA
jgi:putative ATP-dependent endonuclease of OLD family